MSHCPSCRTELVSRNNVPVCPRNEIGECHFDGYSEHEGHTDHEAGVFCEEHHSKLVSTVDY